MSLGKQSVKAVWNPMYSCVVYCLVSQELTNPDETSVVPSAAASVNSSVVAMYLR